MTDRSHLLSALVLSGLLALPTGCSSDSSDQDVLPEETEAPPTDTPATPTPEETEPPTPTAEPTAEPTPGTDRDEDGFNLEDDCNDFNADIYPGAEEVCDELDQDCDDNVDEGLEETLYYQDKDGDGVGDEASTLNSCFVPTGYVTGAGDCDDFDGTVYPGADELCDGEDNDCDENADEGLDFTTYYYDGDGDGFGDDNTTLESCTQPDDYVENAGDCDDDDDDVNPDTVWYGDEDGDGYGDPDNTQTACSQPSGFVINSDDCNDDDTAFSPDATEVCDGIDQDCDGNSDNDTECWDDDGDGFCEENCADGSVAGDCDDDAAYTYPDAPERYDGIDNSCDGSIESGRVFSLDLAHVTFEGWLQLGNVGEALASDGNMNGDISSEGYPLDDLLIGAANHDPQGLYTGAAFLVMGREAGWPGGVASLEDVPGSIVIQGDQASSNTGEAVSFIGDFNDDGLDDFAVGAPRSNGNSGQLLGAGSAFLFSGSEDGWENGTTVQLAATRVDGTAPNVALGTSLSGGDVTGDGFSDLLIGAPDDSNILTGGSGWTFILEGRDEALEAYSGPGEVVKLLGETSYALGYGMEYLGKFNDAEFGNFAAAGYLNNDGHGMALVMNGSDEWSTTLDAIEPAINHASAMYTGSYQSEKVATKYLAGNLDINNDGYTDILMGRGFRGGSSGNEIAYMILGGPETSQDSQEVGVVSEFADVTFTFPDTADQCPCQVASVGDMDGDGFDDFAISATYANDPELDGEDTNRRGRIYLMYGHDGIWPSTFALEELADIVFVGEAQNGRAGTAMSGAGDLNGDGYDDLVISAPFSEKEADDINVAQAGRVYIQFGGPRSFVN